MQGSKSVKAQSKKTGQTKSGTVSANTQISPLWDTIVILKFKPPFRRRCIKDDSYLVWPLCPLWFEGRFDLVHLSLTLILKKVNGENNDTDADTPRCWLAMKSWRGTSSPPPTEVRVLTEELGGALARLARSLQGHQRFSSHQYRPAPLKYTQYRGN